MKKIIGIVIASLMFCNIGFAEIRKIEEKRVDIDGTYNVVATVCIDAYKFVIIRGAKSVSVTQFFAEVPGDGMPGIPAWCG